MNLTEMITRVRRDLKDEATPLRWSEAELTRHINRAVRELSERLPLPAKATLSTTSGSREINISSLSDRIMAHAVEYPTGEFPPKYQQFSIWGHTLTIISGDEPNGSNCYIYYGTLHTLGVSSTIPPQYEDLVATGAGGYAAIQMSIYSTDRVSVGGGITPREFRLWGNQKLSTFRDELKRLGRRQRIRTQQLYKPIL